MVLSRCVNRYSHSYVLKSEFQATIVFEQIWEAIHTFNQDGTRTYRYLILEGSSGSSKTRSAIQAYWLYAIQNANKRLSVWRETKKTCRDTVGKDMSIVYPYMPMYHLTTFNKTESIYQNTNNSTIEICGTDEPNKLHGYNGHVAWLNEPYEISRDTFDQLDMRTEDFVIIDWNPKQGHFIEDIKKDVRTLVLHSTFRDNPFCPAERKTKILSYQPVSLSSVVVERVMKEAEARTYDLTKNKLKLTTRQIAELSRCKENERKKSASEFNWNVYGLGVRAERPNRIFHWQEISDDDYNKIIAKTYYGSDWGVVDPWAIPEVKYYDGAIYIHEKNYLSENEIKAKLLPVELDQVNKMEEGLVMWWFERLGVPKDAYIICDPNRPIKVKALRQAGYDYAITAAKPPGSVIDGVATLEKLTVYYTSSSLNTKYEQENYSREVDRYGVVLETPEDLNNNIIDAVRYIILFLIMQGIIKTI